MKKANEKRVGSRQKVVVDVQSGPGSPFFAKKKNEGQGLLSPHIGKASTSRGKVEMFIYEFISSNPT